MTPPPPSPALRRCAWVRRCATAGPGEPGPMPIVCPGSENPVCGLCRVACRDSPDAPDLYLRGYPECRPALRSPRRETWARDYLAKQDGFEESDNYAYYELGGDDS